MAPLSTKLLDHVGNLPGSFRIALPIPPPYPVLPSSGVVQAVHCAQAPGQGGGWVLESSLCSAGQAMPLAWGDLHLKEGLFPICTKGPGGPAVAPSLPLCLLHPLPLHPRSLTRSAPRPLPPGCQRCPLPTALRLPHHGKYHHLETQIRTHRPWAQGSSRPSTLQCP